MKANGLLEELYPRTLGRFVGMDFFTTEVLTLKGLTTYYVLFFIHLESRQVKLAGFRPHPDQERMEQQGRNMTMEWWGSLRGCRYLLHDRDRKFCPSLEHYHGERNHQGKDNRILVLSRPEARGNMGVVRCRERLGGLLKCYEREAA